MVPIHDTDLAEERWSQSEWQKYELWEQVEQRFRRYRRRWIFATVVVFLILSAVPIVLDQRPKWKTRFIARILAQELNQLKRQAGVDRVAYRFKLQNQASLDYVIEKMPNCAASHGEVVEAGSLVKESLKGLYTWISPAQGQELGVPGLVNEFCYDYLSGSSATSKNEDVIGFGLIPANDLTEKRLDRLTVLLLTGPSAESSFD